MKLFNYFEKKRISFHLRGMVEELRIYTPKNLSIHQLKRRQQQIALLEHYAKNETFPKQKIKKISSLIRDHNGTYCAVAFLAIHSGQKEVINTLARHKNEILFENINNGTLLNWCTKNGLTQKETAKIQPTYGPGMGGSSGSSDTLLLIVFAMFFFIFEFINYHLVKYCKLKKPKTKYLIHAYAFVSAISMALLASLITILLVV